MKNYVTIDGMKGKLKVKLDGERVELTPVIHAKWLVPDEHYPDTCSNCKFEFVWDGDEEYHPKYCPECGAKMDLED